MINGIPVKILKSDKTLGDDIETVYIASFRKCPELAKIHKDFIKSANEFEKLQKINQLYTDKDLISEEEIEKFYLKKDEMVEKIIDAEQKLVDLVFKFCVTGFVAAGYDTVNAERIAGEIGIDRINELFNACRTGSGILDFTVQPK